MKSAILKILLSFSLGISAEKSAVIRGRRLENKKHSRTIR
jgi:hypothetical protein